MSAPSLSPVAAPHVVCPNCKSVLQPETIQSGKKAPTEVRYFCVNETTNCSWCFVLSTNHTNGAYEQVKDKDLVKRREQAKAAAAMRETHDAKVRRLIMLLPHLESMLQALGEGAQQIEEPKTEPKPAAV